MSGTFTSLVVLEGVLTGAAVVMFLYRGMLDMKEVGLMDCPRAQSDLTLQLVSPGVG